MEALPLVSLFILLQFLLRILHHEFTLHHQLILWDPILTWFHLICAHPLLCILMIPFLKLPFLLLKIPPRFLHFCPQLEFVLLLLDDCVQNSSKVEDRALSMLIREFF
uniref:Uncharacterized protein n=1 Tax=Opuntia streptacantha TaxID=393608 RepID=A0A7C9EMR8_OPUST